MLRLLYMLIFVTVEQFMLNHSSQPWEGILCPQPLSLEDTHIGPSQG